jgi:hypothetical protein
MYHYPYFRKARQPALLISWLLPGDVNFITSTNDDTRLSKSKFGCNFVAVNAHGKISQNPKENKFDEIVIMNENQYLPAFIVEFSREQISEKLEALDKKWNRNYSDPTLFQEPNPDDVHHPDIEILSASDYGDQDRLL